MTMELIVDIIKRAENIIVQFIGEVCGITLCFCYLEMTFLYYIN